MPFSPGNQLWKTRLRSGPRRQYETSEDLWSDCCEYFEWVQENPLYEDRIVTYQGVATHEPVAKMRPMSIGGLCIFLGIQQQTWMGWRRNRDDLSSVITQVEEVIRTQKFEGAAADLLNANIISRDLGLADVKKHEGGLTVQVIDDFADDPDTE